MPYLYYLDGGTYSLSGTGGPVQVGLGTTISFGGATNLTGDAAVIPSSIPITAASPGLHGLNASGSTLSLAAGAAFIGGADVASGLGYGAGSGIVSTGDAFTASSGAGPIATGGAGYFAPGAGLWLSNPASLSLTAGTFTGGASVRQAGGAGIQVALSTVNATLGGANLSATGGAGTSTGAALYVKCSSASTLTVVGGSYTGSIAIGCTESGSVVFTGSGLSYSGGALAGTLTDGTAISVAITSLTTGLTSSGSGSSVTFSATAPAIVLHAIGSASGSSVTLSVTSTTAGNLLVGVVSSYSSGPATMPTGWLLSQSFSTNPYLSVWHYPSNPGGITSVTCSATNPVLWVGEVSGIGSPSLVQTATASGATGVVTGAAISADVASLLVAAFCNDDADAATTPTGGFSITDQGTHGANNGLSILTQVATGGTYTPGCTLPTGYGFAEITASFRQ